MKITQNRIWIELELPENFDDKKAEKIAKDACIVLNTMGVDYDIPVWWSSKDKRFCFTMDTAGSFVVADDNGHWYSLDYLAKQARAKMKKVNNNNERSALYALNPLYSKIK